MNIVPNTSILKVIKVQVLEAIPSEILNDYFKLKNIKENHSLISNTFNK